MLWVQESGVWSLIPHGLTVAIGNSFTCGFCFGPAVNSILTFPCSFSGFKEVFSHHVLWRHRLDCSIFLFDGMVGTSGKILITKPSSHFSLTCQMVHHCACFLYHTWRPYSIHSDKTWHKVQNWTEGICSTLLCILDFSNSIKSALPQLPCGKERSSLLALCILNQPKPETNVMVLSYSVAFTYLLSLFSG